MFRVAIVRLSVAILLLLLTDLTPLSATVNVSVRNYDVQSRRLKVWSTCERRRVTISNSGGVFDYSGQINDMLMSLSEQGGGALVFNSGIYPVKSPVVLKSNTCLIGNNSDTVLQLANYSYPFYPKQGLLSIPKGTENIAVLRLDISGNHDAQFNASHAHYYSHGRTAVFIDGARAVWLRDVNVYNNSNHGIYVKDTSDITITGVVSVGNKMDGIYLENSKHAILRNVSANDNLRDGVSISGKDTNDVSIYHAMAKHNMRCGISTADKAGTISINKACVEQCGFAGICVDDHSERVFVSFVNITNGEGNNESGCFSVKKKSRQIIFGDNIRCENHDHSNTGKVFVGEHSRSYCTKGVIYDDVCVPLEEWGTSDKGTSERVGEVRKLRQSCSCTAPPCTLSSFNADSWPVNCVLKNGVFH